ncbi:MAG: RNA methyltransferase [Anaerolineae bacterium]|nr:RNA methyltransferase [Anaerolineae bacterium]
MSPISSPHNDRVKLVRALQNQAKMRRHHRLAVLEGVRLVCDVWKAGTPPDVVFYVPQGPVEDVIAALQADGIVCLEVTGQLLRDMSATETPPGILGVFPWPALELPEAPDLIVVADGWRDPGNLGTLLRTAAAAGVDLVTLTPGTVDPFNPKTLRAGMGAQYRVPIGVWDWPDLVARYGDRAWYVADARGTVSYDGVDWTHPSVVVIGGEAHGAGSDVQRVPHTAVRIPMVSGVESLNAAVAASLVIYAARRHTLAP